MNRTFFRARAVIATIVVLAAWAVPLSAHDLWIEPPASVGIDTVVPIEVRIGHAGSGEVVARENARIERLRAHAPSDPTGVEIPGLDGSSPFGVLRPKLPGSWIAIYESEPFVHRLGAERFRAYLEEEGLDEVLDARKKSGSENRPGIELVSRSVKTLFSVGDATLEDRRIGLPVEIVAESIPVDFSARSNDLDSTYLVLRVEVEGRPRADVLVDLQNLDGNAAPVASRTDADGRVRFSVGPGAWLAAAVVSRPFVDDEDGADRADWRTIFASWAVVLR